MKEISDNSNKENIETDDTKDTSEEDKSQIIAHNETNPSEKLNQQVEAEDTKNDNQKEEINEESRISDQKEKTKTENKTFSNLKQKLPGLKIHPRFKTKRFALIISVIFLILSAISILSILAIYTPTIHLSYVSLSIENKPTDSKINAEEIYPNINDDGKIEISVNDELLTVADQEYKFSKDDLNEGNNKIKLSTLNDYFFIKIASAESHQYMISVDREYPQYSLSEESTKENDYLVLSPAKIILDTEEEAKIIVGEDEYKFSELEKLSEESNYRVINQKLNNGENIYDVYIEDTFGNRVKIEDQKFQFTAFQKDGFTKKDCNGIEFPLSDLLRLGYSGFRDERYIDISLTSYSSKAEAIADFNKESDICTEQKMSYQIFLKTDSFINCIPCGGPGIVSDHIYFGDYTDVYKSTINAARRAGQIIDEREVEMPQGKVMRYIKTKDDNSLIYDDIFYNRYYIFDYKGREYVMEYSNFNESRGPLSDHMVEIANAIRLDE